MDKTYAKTLNDLVDNFLNALKKIEKQKEGEIEELERKILLTEQERNTLKAQQKKNNEVLKINQDSLNKETQKTAELNTQISKEISKYTDLNRELTHSKNEVESIRKQVKINNQSAVDELTKQRGHTEEYRKKLDALKTTEDKLEDEKKQLRERERQIEIKEKNNLKTKAKNVNKEKELEELGLDLQIKRKNLDLAMKRLKLK